MKTITITYSFLLSIMLLAGCKVSKDTSIPADINVVQYRNATATDTTGIGTIQWKNFFTDPALQQLIDSTIANNYDMQAALKNIDAAKLLLQQSKLGYLPTANLQVTGAINRPSDNSLNGLSLSQFLGKSYVEDYTVSAVLGWEADIWGRIKNQQSKSLAIYLQTQEARKAIQTNLVAAVAQGYYNLLMLDAQVDVAKKNLLLNDSTLNIIRFQYEAGQATALAIQQTEAQRLAAAQLIPRLEREIVIQENALSVLAAVSPASVHRNSDLKNISFAQNISAGVPSTLLSNRPDVKQTELALTVANANTAIAKAAMYPSLTITAAGGVNAFKASNWFNLPASLFVSAAGGITQPLFQRRQLKTQYQVSQVEREKTVIQFRQSVLNAVGEVSDALVQVQKLQEEQSVAATRVNTLQQATGNANLLFKNGLATYLEVITAQSNVLQAELELVMLKKQLLSAVVELYRSLGGGWQ